VKHAATGMSKLYIKHQNNSAGAARQVFIHQHVTATHIRMYYGSGTVEGIASGQPADAAAAPACAAAGAKRTWRMHSTDDIVK